MTDRIVAKAFEQIAKDVVKSEMREANKRIKERLKRLPEELEVFVKRLADRDKTEFHLIVRIPSEEE